MIQSKTINDAKFERHLMADFLYGLILFGILYSGQGHWTLLLLSYLAVALALGLRALPSIAPHVPGSWSTLLNLLPWPCAFMLWNGIERLSRSIPSGRWILALALTMTLVMIQALVRRRQQHPATKEDEESVILACWPLVQRQVFHLSLLLLAGFGLQLLSTPNFGMEFLLSKPHVFFTPMLALYYLLINNSERGPFDWRDHSSGLLTLAGVMLPILLAPMVLTSSFFNMAKSTHAWAEPLLMLLLACEKVGVLLIKRRQVEKDSGAHWSLIPQLILAFITMFFSLGWMVQQMWQLMPDYGLDVIGFTLLNCLIGLEFLFDGRSDAAVSSGIDVHQLEVSPRSAREERVGKKIDRHSIGKAVRRGVSVNLRNDMYFYFMEASWPKTLLLIAISYLLTNTIFAIIYSMVPGSIAGAKDNSLFDAFFFSVHTLSTVGYGTLAPNNLFAHMIVTIEAACGLIGVAVVTGLVFSKISRPKSGVVFSRPLIVTRIEGRPYLAFRVGNTRGNDVVDANITFTVLLSQKTSEGHNFRRAYDLKLVRERTPFFSLSWTVMHPLDEESPLKELVNGETPHNLVALMAILIGHDSSYSATVYARHTYLSEDIVYNHHFVDVLSEDEEGKLVIDYRKFNDVKPLA